MRNTWGLWFNMSAHGTSASFPNDGNLTCLNQVQVVSDLVMHVRSISIRFIICKTSSYKDALLYSCTWGLVTTWLKNPQIKKPRAHFQNLPQHAVKLWLHERNCYGIWIILVQGRDGLQVGRKVSRTPIWMCPRNKPGKITWQILKLQVSNQQWTNVAAT